MSDLNIVALMGRITRDAEMKPTASGKSFVRFSIAVNRTRKQGENYQVNRAIFPGCRNSCHRIQRYVYGVDVQQPDSFYRR